MHWSVRATGELCDGGDCGECGGASLDDGPYVLHHPTHVAHGGGRATREMRVQPHVRQPQQRIVEPERLRLVHVAVVEEGGELRGVTATELPLATVARQGSGSRDHPCADPNAFCFPTRLGPVAIERPFENARTSGSSDSFAVQTPLGEPLLTAVVRPEDLALTRERWRQATQSIALMVLAATVLLISAAAPAMATFAQVPEPSTLFLIGGGLGALILLARRKRGSK